MLIFTYFTNIEDHETLKMMIDEHQVEQGGRLRSERTWTEDINARQFAENLVKTE